MTIRDDLIAARLLRPASELEPADRTGAGERFLPLDEAGRREHEATVARAYRPATTGAGSILSYLGKRSP